MISHARGLVAILGCFWIAAVAGCASSVPEFARPKLMTGDEGVFTDDVIPYRVLTRADFRAALPPAGLEEYAEQMGAVTCAAIRSKPGAGFSVVQRGRLAEVRVEDLVFAVEMDRGCSWWNTKREKYADAYVLEHEQVHLALFEVEARRLTERLALESVSAAYDSDPELLAALFEDTIKRELNAATEAVLERSLQFDEDTSFRYQPKLQRRWLETVERELAEHPN